LRIISGTLKSRRISAPKNLPVRPTTDRAKEGLFNIIQHQFDFSETAILDLFAGTGNISFEFASRGCENLTCVDSNFHCIKFIQKTITDLNLSGIKAVKANAFSFIKNNSKSYDLIFADPPYQLKEIETLPDLIFENNLLSDNGFFILEHPPQISFSEHPRLADHRVYGLVNFSFFR
jgi:16S rRNA (guanine(966)-N(2))-methyltransferase RsmD